MRRVVDTNVPVVANGRNTNASATCRQKAIRFLMDVINDGCIILDLDGEIQDEYLRYLNPSGQPGVGDRFFQLILNSAPSKVERIKLDKDPQTKEFVDFPKDPALADFDKSDRKFAAAARKSGAPVANATDRKSWHRYHTALTANDISVEFVCGCDPTTWFVDT